MKQNTKSQKTETSKVSKQKGEFAALFNQRLVKIPKYKFPLSKDEKYESD